MGFPFAPPQGLGQVVGTATAADVLTGYTFSSEAAGIGVAGTMPNNGAPTLYPGEGISQGYYSGGQIASLIFSATSGSGSINLPPNSLCLVILIGGGGGAGASNSSYVGGAGGSGQAIVGFISNYSAYTSSSNVTNLTYSVGTGGATAAANSGAAGGDGTATTLSFTINNGTTTYSWTTGYGQGGGAATASGPGSGGGQTAGSQNYNSEGAYVFWTDTVNSDGNGRFYPMPFDAGVGAYWYNTTQNTGNGGTGGVFIYRLY